MFLQADEQGGEIGVPGKDDEFVELGGVGKVVHAVHDQVDVLCDLVFSRLMYPYRLEKDGETAYEDYVRDSEKEVAEYLTDREDLEALRQISARGMWQEKDLDQAADYAARTKKSEILAFLMEEKHRLFPVRKKKFEL